MSATISLTRCTVCGSSRFAGSSCSECGSDQYVLVEDGAVVAFSPGTLPCAGCGANAPLIFRGWSYLRSFLYWAQEGRKGGYVCSACARRESAKALLYTALLGWLSVPSWLYAGWRATFHNWNSVFRRPSDPLKWGALSSHDLDEILAESQRAYEEAVEEYIFESSPLASLNESQVRLVTSSERLYETLGVGHTASTDEIRHAYRECARQAHPDLNAGADAERMVQVNRAWEVLGTAETRAAYDWLQEQRAA